MKKVVNTWDVELAVKMKARNVLKPPLRTAGPIPFRVFVALSSPEPLKIEINYIKLNKLSNHGQPNLQFAFAIFRYIIIFLQS